MPLHLFRNGLYDNITISIRDKDMNVLTETKLSPNHEEEIHFSNANMIVIESYDRAQNIYRKEVTYGEYIQENEHIIGIGEHKYHQVVIYFDFTADVYIGLSYIIPNRYIIPFYVLMYFIYIFAIIVTVVLIVIFGANMIN